MRILGVLSRLGWETYGWVRELDARQLVADLGETWVGEGGAVGEDHGRNGLVAAVDRLDQLGRTGMIFDVDFGVADPGPA